MTPAAIEPETFRFVAQYLNHCATAVPTVINVLSFNCNYLIKSYIKLQLYIYIYIYIYDRLCGLVVRVSGCKYRGPGFDPRRYQIF